MKKNRRTAHVREVGDDGRTFTAMAVRYGVVDSYNTVFDAGCFTESIEKRLPTVSWAHDWSDPVGRIFQYEDTPEGLLVHGRLSDPESVPRAKQAMAQLRDGTIDDVSVGFSIEDDDETEKHDGVIHFVKATLDELALVLRGAVPGSKILAVRSSQVISAEAAAAIIVRFNQGEIDLAEALTAVKDGAIDEPEPKPDEPETPKPDEEAAPSEQETETPEEPEVPDPDLPDEEAAEMDLAIEEALALVASK